MDDTTTFTRTPFGKPMAAHFSFSAGWRNFNHGSFGATPKHIMNTMRAFQDEAESNPDVFYRNAFPEHLLASRRATASLLNAPLPCTVLVQNATTGVNTVLRNLTFEPGDHILLFSTCYPSTAKTALYIASTTAASVTNIPLAYPCADADILAAFTAAITSLHSAHATPKLAIFDTLSAAPGVPLPTAALCALCTTHNILSLVDAAHGAGLLPLDLPALAPDFLVTNLHKWLFVPRGCAALYVAPSRQPLIRSSVPTSWGFVPPAAAPLGHEASYTAPTAAPDTPFEALFATGGTIDASGWFCVPAALRWRREVCGGEAAIHAYCGALAETGCAAVAAALGTEVLGDAGGGAVRCVRLAVEGGKLADGERAARWAQDVLVSEFKTFVPVFRHAGALWVRVCAQVYLEQADFEWLGGVLGGVCRRLSEGEYLA